MYVCTSPLVMALHIEFEKGGGYSKSILNTLTKSLLVAIMAAILSMITLHITILPTDNMILYEQMKELRNI